MFVRAAALFSVISFTACSTAGPPSTPPVASGSETRTDLIDHLEPARDSTGRMPQRFRWTPVPGEATTISDVIRNSMLTATLLALESSRRTL